MEKKTIFIIAGVAGGVGALVLIAIIVGSCYATSRTCATYYYTSGLTCASCPTASYGLIDECIITSQQCANYSSANPTTSVTSGSVTKSLQSYPNFSTFASSISLQQTVTSSQITASSSGAFESLTNSSGSMFYVVNDNGGFTTYDSKWNYLTTKSYANVDGYMATINNYIFIAGITTNRFQKFDSNFNLIKSITLLGASNGGQNSNGIDYDVCNSRLLCLTHTNSDNTIWVFDTNFNSIGNISLTSYISSTINPSGLAYFKNKIYVGGDNGYIYIFNNTGLSVSLLTSYKVCNTSTYINSVEHDLYGNIIITCNNEGYIYFYSSANVFITAYATTGFTTPTFASTDASGRVVVLDTTTTKKILLYF